MVLSTVLRLLKGASDKGEKLKERRKRGTLRKSSDDNQSKEDNKISKQDKLNKSNIKLAKSALSNAIILCVGLIEDTLFALFSLFLSSVLVIVPLIVMVVATVTFSIEGVKAALADGGFSYPNASGVVITDPSTYDWWGNKDTNMLLLTNDYDKELYQVIACSMELQKYSEADTSNNRLWNGAVGVGLLLAEMNGGMSSAVSNYHDGSDAEIHQLKYDKCNYVYAYMCTGYTTDGLGDGPIGLSWDLASDRSYDFGPFSVKKVNKSYLKDSMSKSGKTGYSENQAYAQWTLPGGLMWSYYNSDDYTYTEERTSLYNLWGVDTTEKNLIGIAVYDYYAKHHGRGDVDSKNILTYMLALYRYLGNDLSNIVLVDSDGNLQSKESAWHDVYSETLSKDFGRSADGNIRVTRNGEDHIFDFENGDTLGKALLDWAKKEYGASSENYKGLKSAIDWGEQGAPYFKNSAGVNNALYNSNLSNCVGIFIIGQTLVNHMVETLGISVGDTEEVGGSSSSVGNTSTSKALVDFARNTYKEHGPDSSDVWTSSHNALNPDGSTFNSEWCAATVKYFLRNTKVNGSTKTLFELLDSTADSAFLDSNFADLGYDGGAVSNTTILRWDGKSKGNNATKLGKYVTVHYTGMKTTWGFQGKPTKDKNGVLSYESKYTPKAGDIVVYNWNSGYTFDHVGLIVSDGDKFETIEGNASGGMMSNHKSGEVRYDNVLLIFDIDFDALERDYGKQSQASTNSSDINSYILAQAETLGLSDDNLAKSSQIVDVVCSGTSCKITTYNKSGSTWSKGSVNNVAGYIGRSGVGSKTANANEGSEKTPWGARWLGVNFGGFGVSMSGLKIDWKDVSSKQAYWGTSNNSSHLNRFYWASSAEKSDDEDLTAICKGGSYKYAILIEYNYTNAKVGNGSAFFLHVGSSPTAGCVATDEDTMLSIVKWVDKSKNTLIFIH